MNTPLPDIALGLARVDALGRLRELNPTLAQWAAGRERLDQLFPGLDLTDWLQRSAGRGWQALSLQRKGAEALPMLVRLETSSSGQHWLALCERADTAGRLVIDGLQREVLEAVAADQPLPVLMERLCLGVEAVCPGVRCSVVRIDAQGRLRPLAGPSLPRGYAEAIEGAPIGEAVGSCGTAAFRGSEVDVADIATDPLWADYRELAQQFDLRACWSSPVRVNGRVAATFALYYRDASRIEPFVRRVVDACLHLVAVALRHDEARQHIERLAHFDSVTGLPNQRQLELRLQALAGGARQALLLLGLDRFKALNEALGQARGDAVLVAVGQRLREAGGEQGFVARVGGDEFALLLPPSSPSALTADAARAAKRLQAMLAQPLTMGEQLELRPAGSIGIVLGEAGLNPQQMLHNARLALREAKAAGKSSVRFFLTQSHQELEQRLQLESLLERALDTDELSLVFQPKLSLQDRRVVGAEALLRWNSPALGAVPPDRFIPLAEEVGLIARIDAWVAERALHQLAAWEREGLRLANLSVNVSALSLGQPGYVDELLGRLDRQGLEPDRLTLELTERAVVAEGQAEGGVLQALHAAGLRLSVDDFGTGYSSLSYLRRLPVQELKLDRTFVAELLDNPRDQALVRAVVGLAESMGCEIVAEGVENAAQIDCLLRLGCHAVQGYGIARPLAEADFLAFLRRPVPVG